MWVDKQTAVDCLRVLIQNTGNPDIWEHVDLWRHIDAPLRRSVASIYVHKVDSHEATEHSTGPVADFAITWNAAADLQAKIANCSRLGFFNGVWSHFRGYRDVWRRRTGLLTKYSGTGLCP